MIHLTIEHQKHVGEGEDSPPFAGPVGDVTLLVVCDGMGGAGAAKVTSSDGSTRTQAYLASRAVAATIIEAVHAMPEWFSIASEQVVETLETATRDVLLAQQSQLAIGPSRIRSSMKRILPTTLAMAVVGPVANGTRLVDVLWAGDSRVYGLDPLLGLVQLTADDLTDAQDALGNLRSDSPVSNALSADREFEIHLRRYELPAGCLVLGVTDGCFGYLPSPMHFEHLLLEGLSAGGVDDVSAALLARIQPVTGDDSTIAMAIPQETVEDSFRGFEARRARVHTLVARIDEAKADVSQAQKAVAALTAKADEIVTATWESFRPGYEHLLGAGAAVAPPGPQLPEPPPDETGQPADDLVRPAGKRRSRPLRAERG